MYLHTNLSPCYSQYLPRFIFMVKIVVSLKAQKQNDSLLLHLTAHGHGFIYVRTCGYALIILTHALTG